MKIIFKIDALENGVSFTVKIPIISIFRNIFINFARNY